MIGRVITVMMIRWWSKEGEEEGLEEQQGIRRTIPPPPFSQAIDRGMNNVLQGPQGGICKIFASAPCLAHGTSNGENTSSEWFTRFAFWPMGMPIWLQTANVHDVVKLQVYAIPQHFEPRKSVHWFQRYVLWPTGTPIWVKWTNAEDAAKLSEKFHRILNRINPSNRFRDSHSCQWTSPYGSSGHQWASRVWQMDKWYDAESRDYFIELRMGKIRPAVSELL